jgi:hypothetical protein
MKDDQFAKLGEQHYKKGGMQPLVYIEANKLPFAEGCVVKYASRHMHSETPVKDLYDASNYCYLMLRDRYGCGPYVDGRVVPMYNNVPPEPVNSVYEPRVPVEDINQPTVEDFNDLYKVVRDRFPANSVITHKQLVREAASLLTALLSPQRV